MLGRSDRVGGREGEGGGRERGRERKGREGERERGMEGEGGDREKEGGREGERGGVRREKEREGEGEREKGIYFLQRCEYCDVHLCLGIGCRITSFHINVVKNALFGFFGVSLAYSLV